MFRSISPRSYARVSCITEDGSCCANIPRNRALEVFHRCKVLYSANARDGFHRQRRRPPPILRRFPSIDTLCTRGGTDEMDFAGTRVREHRSRSVMHHAVYPWKFRNPHCGRWLQCAYATCVDAFRKGSRHVREIEVHGRHPENLSPSSAFHDARSECDVRGTHPLTIPPLIVNVV